DEIWKEGGYNGVFDEMLTLMERFELCYALPNSPNEFIVPQLLSPDKPSYNWDDINQIRLHYRYTFMPKGIVTRLIVRLNRLIVDQKTVWQSCVVFESEGAQAEVSELYHNRYIHIKSKGINRKALMTIITHQIDEINSTFDFDEQLKVSQLIPCNCTTCKQAESPYFFPKEVLNKAMSVGRKNLQCQDSFDGVSIRELFYDTFDREVIEHEEEAYPKGRELTKHEYHFHGPVDSVIPYNQGNIIQQFDHRTLIQELKPFKQLIEAEKEVGYISREEYEDLIDILAEIQETPDPKEGQKRRWKRWLGTAATSVSNFIKGRFEKGTDTVIQEEVKAWLKEGGLEKLMELISSF
ncbi:MAG: COR domain-containing protein, partial [Bacteroidota bacterium]